MNNPIQADIKAETQEQNQAQVAVSVDQTQNIPDQNFSSEAQKENWKKFREQKEIERRQRIEAERIAAEKAKEAEAFKAALEALVNNKSNNQNDYGTNQYQQQEEDIIQKKVDAALASRERQYEEQRKQREHQEMPQKLARDYPDFERVCTNENLDYLQYHYPEVAAAFKNLPDSYDNWSNIYKAVKRFVPNTNAQKDVKKADANLNKPQSISNPGLTRDSTMPPPTRLDKARMDANWERMQRTIKGVS